MRPILLYILMPAVLAVLLTNVSALAAVRGDHAMYVGGTITGIQKDTEGKLDLSGGTDLIFIYHKETVLHIPFRQIVSIEYGQHAGRRIRAALLGGGWPLLLSHKRRHYLSLGFKDETGREQAAVFELAKHTVRTTLATLKAKSGKEVEFDSEDAKKNVD